MSTFTEQGRNMGSGGPMIYRAAYYTVLKIGNTCLYQGAAVDFTGKVTTWGYVGETAKPQPDAKDVHPDTLQFEEQPA